MSAGCEVSIASGGRVIGYARGITLKAETNGRNMHITGMLPEFLINAQLLRDANKIPNVSPMLTTFSLVLCDASTGAVMIVEKVRFDSWKYDEAAGEFIATDGGTTFSAEGMSG